MNKNSLYFFALTCLCACDGSDSDRAPPTLLKVTLGSQTNLEIVSPLNPFETEPTTASGTDHIQFHFSEPILPSSVETYDVDLITGDVTAIHPKEGVIEVKNEANETVASTFVHVLDERTLTVSSSDEAGFAPGHNYSIRLLNTSLSDAHNNKMPAYSAEEPTVAAAVSIHVPSATP